MLWGPLSGWSWRHRAEKTHLQVPGCPSRKTTPITESDHLGGFVKWRRIERAYKREQGLEEDYRVPPWDFVTIVLRKPFIVSPKP